MKIHLGKLYLFIYLFIYSLIYLLYSLIKYFYCNYSNIQLYDTIVKLDGRMKHFIINLVAKEFTDTTCADIGQEIDLLRASLHELC